LPTAKTAINEAAAKPLALQREGRLTLGEIAQ
jgi:hypothetical protein